MISPRPTIRRFFWPALWLIFYTLIILLGVFAPDSPFLTLIKLSGIFLCFVYAVYRFPRARLLQAALFATCLADVLLAGDNTSVFGLLVFFLAQLLHLFRLSDQHFRRPLIAFAVFAALILLLNLCFCLVPPLFLVVAFYATTLILNLTLSYRWSRRAPADPHARLAFYGFFLFACCDLCTVVSYLSHTLVLPALLYAPANYFAWFFYYPSQIFVSNSPRCATIDSKGR